MDDIIYFNFKTNVPEEVNWYLHHYVGCERTTADGKNYVFGFSGAAKAGKRKARIYIPPQQFSFPPVTIEGTLPPRFFSVHEDPQTWTPPPMTDDGATARIIVTRAPWTHETLTVGGLAVRTRKQWGAGEPDWEKEVIFYNTFRASLRDTLRTIIIHHTANGADILTNEKREKSRGFAALGYHFFIDKEGVISEGRPLEVMGSNAGEGETPGPTNDPDWGAIGIVVQGDYDGFFASDPPAKQLDALESLVVALQSTFTIERLLMHREIKRKGTATVCPGANMVPHVEALRKKLRIPGL
jgi:hypothetical protein